MELGVACLFKASRSKNDSSQSHTNINTYKQLREWHPITLPIWHSLIKESIIFAVFCWLKQVAGSSNTKGKNLPGHYTGGRGHGGHLRILLPQKTSGTQDWYCKWVIVVCVLKELRTPSSTEGAWSLPLSFATIIIKKVPSIIHPAQSVISLSKVIWDIAMQRATSLLSRDFHWVHIPFDVLESLSRPKGSVPYYCLGGNASVRDELCQLLTIASELPNSKC